MGRGTRQHDAITAGELRSSLTRPAAGRPGWMSADAALREELAGMAGRARRLDFGMDWENAAQAAADISVRCEELSGRFMGTDVGLTLAMAADQMYLARDHDNAEEANRAVAVGADLLDAAARQLPAA